ncbi:hypothetical protein H0N95_00245 [Candidatus Micrarchaeota archaeon]|nr:hypothetical protein [Candidatus Micrarchaeota archaeon]
MQIGIVDSSGENLADEFERFVHERVEQVVSKKKKALDLFDALALLKQFEGMDHRVIIAKLVREQEQREEAFFEALANLEASTGKIVFKCVYYEDEDGHAAITKTAEQFLEYVFGKKPDEEEAEETEEAPDVGDEDLPEPDLLIK